MPESMSETTITESANKDSISFDDFLKVDLRLGRILEALPFPKARKPAYRLRIDFGPLGVKASSAQITALYSPDELVGRQVVAVVNFAPRNIAGFSSEVLVLGLDDGTGRVALLGVDRDLPLGARVY